jgi:ribosomal protein S18 acetylase RimI-like enzyme
MHIEPAVVEDAPAILTLQRLCYRSEAAIYNDYTIPPLTQTLEELRSEFGSHVFLKALDNGGIIGSVRARKEQDTCAIGRLIVHPDFQNRGIGTGLMRSIEGRFPGAARFELFTGDKSIRNIELYSALGYREFKRESLTPQVTFVYMKKVIR